MVQQFRLDPDVPTRRAHVAVTTVRDLGSSPRPPVIIGSGSQSRPRDSGKHRIAYGVYGITTMSCCHHPPFDTNVTNLAVLYLFTKRLQTRRVSTRTMRLIQKNTAMKSSARRYLKLWI